MSTTETGQEPGTENDNTGQEPGGTGTETEGQAPPAGTSTEGKDLPGDESWPTEAREALRAARDEAAGNRVKAREAAEALAAIEREKMSDLERAQADAAAAREAADAAAAALAERDLTDTARRTARDLKFRDPDLAVSLIDRSAVIKDDNGQPVNLKELLEAKAQAHPYLLATAASVDAGAGGDGAAGGQSMNDIIRRGR